MKPGDYVVHENHGLGIFRGIEKIEVDKTMRDYMKIEYDKGGNLYVLATQLDLIQKYAGADAKKPKLNRLGGQEWTKTTTPGTDSGTDRSHRNWWNCMRSGRSKEGYEYGPDTVWQREFEEMFPYEETDDQRLAIEATKSGYGKQEDHGSSDLRRCRLWQDGGGNPGGVQSSTGEINRLFIWCRLRFWRSSITIRLHSG